MPVLGPIWSCKYPGRLYKTEETEAQKGKNDLPNITQLSKECSSHLGQYTWPRSQGYNIYTTSWITPLAVALAAGLHPRPVQSHDSALPVKLCKISVVTL